jgi:hypothetical protein
MGQTNRDDRRKLRKAKKARLLVKKQANLHEKHYAKDALVGFTEQVLRIVQDREARIAVTTTPDSLLVVAMWESHGVDVHLARSNDPLALAELAVKARNHVRDEEWSAFLADHALAVRSAHGDASAVSMIEWKPGEGPDLGGLT